MRKSTGFLVGVALIATGMAAPAMAKGDRSKTKATVQTATASRTTTTMTTAQTTARRGLSAGLNDRGGKKNTVTTSAPVSSQSNGSTVAIVGGACDSLTDGDLMGCQFTGNINTSTSGNSSYLLAQGAYNDAFDPNITLTPLATFDGSGSSGGINFTLDSDMDSGSWTLAPGVDLDYFAVKSGNGFILYEYTGQNSFTTAGLGNGNGDSTPDLSHIIFFGGAGGGVPEPATWAIMLLGFGMIGSGMRRRRFRRDLTQVLA